MNNYGRIKNMTVEEMAIEKVIKFAYEQSFINKKEYDKLIKQQNTIYHNFEKLEERKFERNESYILHYDREDIYCECQICKKKSHNFYAIYEPSIRLNTDIPLMKDVFRDKYFVCEKCMKNDKSLQYRFLD